MARVYDISLLPALREQVAFYHQKNEELSAHVEQAYETFLNFVDSKSESLSGDESYDDLQRVYQMVCDRKEALLAVLDQEQDDIEFWEKKLGELNEKTDHEQWQSIATELIEDGDYRLDTKEFITWMTQQSTELQQELTELLDDWHAAVEEGAIKELSTLLEVLADDQESEGEEIDPMRGLEEMSEGDDSSAEENGFRIEPGMTCHSGPSTRHPAPDRVRGDEPIRHPELVSGSTHQEEEAGGSCCATEQREAHGCCGRQVPCCRSKE